MRRTWVALGLSVVLAGGCAVSAMAAAPVVVQRVEAAGLPLRGARPAESAFPEAAPLAAGQQGLFVVQFRDVITEEARALLESSGVEVGPYIGERAFVVRATPQAAQALAGSDLVAQVSRYQAAWKVDPDLQGRKGKATLAVTTFPSATAAPGALQAMGARPAGAHGSYVLTGVDRSEATRLAGLEEVLFVEELAPVVVHNDQARSIMGVSTSPGVWEQGITGTNQVVGVADTGFDTGNLSTLHLDLRSQVLSAAGLYRPTDWSDVSGHGTHVAGTIAGDGTQSGGTYKGVAPGAKLVLQSIGTGTGDGVTVPNNDLKAILVDAYNKGARIHSNSWGQTYPSGFKYDAWAASVDAATWERKDYTVFWAAGNNGAQDAGSVTGLGTLTSPATAKNTITIGASESVRQGYGTGADNANQKAGFSSAGYTPDHRIKPDLMAPGTAIISTKSSKIANNTSLGALGAYYTVMQGTSMATPAAAGAGALVRQYYQDKQGLSNPPASLIKATLINGARDMGYGWGNRNQGWGRIDVVNSLFPAGGRANWFEGEAESLSTGETVPYAFHVEAGEIFKASLVWTDYAGSPASKNNLVNDLDLLVRGPEGNWYVGNCFVNNTAGTLAKCTADSLNNVENVYIQAPVTGTYQVMVSGYNVPMGPQPYSLVVSGKGLSRDTATPTITFATLGTGKVVKGAALAVALNVADDAAVTRVELYKNAETTPFVTLTGAPWQTSFDTTAVPDGALKLTARAYDATGNMAEAFVDLKVDNTAPALTVTGLTDGAYVKSALVLKTAASDANGLTDVTHTLDGATVQQKTAAPFDWTWNTATAADGPHQVTVTARDKAGNQTTKQANVTVDNTLPTLSVSGLTAGSVIKGSVQVTATAADNLTVDRVEFYQDTTKLFTATTAPYVWSWDTTRASSASHNAVVKAYDKAGNLVQQSIQVYVDNTAPIIGAVTVANGDALKGVRDVTATVTDTSPGTRVEFFLDGGAGPLASLTAAPYKWTFDTSTVPEGPHSITIRATDAVGNQAEKVLNVTVDNTAPTITIDSPTAGALVGAIPVSVQAAAQDNSVIAKVEFFLDAATTPAFTDTAAPFVWNWDAAKVTSGSHTLKARVTDKAGATAQATVSVTVDSTKPTISLTTPPANAGLVGTVEVKATAADPQGISKVEFYLDAQLAQTLTTAPYTWLWDTTTAAAGVHKLQAKAYDTAGNTTASPLTSVTVDNTPPSEATLSVADGALIKNGTLLTATATDNLAVKQVEFYADGVLKLTDTAAPYAWTTTGLTDGAHTLSIRVVDRAGNALASTPVSVTVDSTPPANVVLTGLTAGQVVQGDVALTVTATDNGGQLRAEFWLDSKLTQTVTAEPFTWTWATTTAKDGAHSLLVKVYDGAGNMKATPALSFKVDNTAPVISSVTPADGAYVKGTAAVTVAATDAGGVTKVEYYLDGSASPTATDTAAPYSWSWNTTAAAAGAHVVAVKVYDAAGRVAERSLTLSVDNTPPTVAITDPAAGSVFGPTTVPVNATITEENIRKVEYLLNGAVKYTATAAPWTWNWNTATTASGTYTLTVRVTDMAGSVATSAGRSITLDTTKPSLTLSAPAAGATLKGTVNLTPTVSDARGVARVEFWLDGVSQATVTAPGPYTWAWDTTTAAGGPHTLTVKAYDTTGNLNSVERAVKVDNDAPTVSYRTLTDGAVLKLAAPIEIDAQDNVGVTKAEYYWDGTKLATVTAAPFKWAVPSTATQGSHTLKVTVYDAAGFTATSATITITVDKTLPVISSVTGIASSTTVSGTRNVAVQVSDNMAVQRVEFWVGTEKVYTDTSGTATATWDWDTLTTPNGSRTVKIVVYDVAGNMTTRTYTLTVRN